MHSEASPKQLGMRQRRLSHQSEKPPREEPRTATGTKEWGRGERREDKNAFTKQETKKSTANTENGRRSRHVLAAGNCASTVFVSMQQVR